nr:hypothetical protein [Edaphobacter modestus]
MRQPTSTSCWATSASTNSVCFFSRIVRRELSGKLLRASAVFRLREDLVDRIAYLLRLWRIGGEIDARPHPGNTSSDLRFVLAVAHYYHGHTKAERLYHGSVATEGDQHIHIG